MIPEKPLGPDAFIAIMPGGTVVDWTGNANNYGGSITGSKAGVGLDYVDLLSVDKTEITGSCIVLTIKPGGSLGAEGHFVRSETTPISENPNNPFNIYKWYDEKTGDILAWIG